MPVPLWGLSPQTAPADILRVLAVLVHIQDHAGPFFFLPSSPGKGPADGHLSSIIHPSLCVIMTLGESRLQKKGMIKEKTESGETEKGRVQGRGGEIGAKAEIKRADVVGKGGGGKED